MSTGDWIALGGDTLVFVGLVATLFVYLSQRAQSSEQLRKSALATLIAARYGIDTSASFYFANSYDEEATEKKAEDAYNDFLEGGSLIYLPVPIEPLTSVLAQPDPGRFIKLTTIKAVNMAIYVIGWFSQMVEEQNVFRGVHAKELMGMASDDESREAIARYLRETSRALHGKIIGNAIWYSELLGALDHNIKELNELGRQKWWQQLRQSSPSESR